MKRYPVIERRGKELAISTKKWVVIARNVFSPRKKPSLYTFLTCPTETQMQCVEVHCIFDPKGNVKESH